MGKKWWRLLVRLDESDPPLVRLGERFIDTGNQIMATQAELAQILRDVRAQQDKTAAEIDAMHQTAAELRDTIQQLEDAVANSGAVSQELQDAVQAVKDKAQEIDDQIPDLPPPVEPPEE